MTTVDDLIPLIYHEKQEPGSMLCAQHALNSLLREQPYLSFFLVCLNRPSCGAERDEVSLHNFLHRRL